MKQLKKETIEHLKSLRPRDFNLFHREHSTDVLNKSLEHFYNKPQYWLRTNSGLIDKGNWASNHTGSSYAKPYYCMSWMGLREVGKAHELNQWIKHTGWFADSFQDGLIIGYVLQLPARENTPRYIPAYYSTDSDGVTIYPLDWYEDAEEAARAADRYAEIYAEECREYSAKDQAEQQIEDCHEEAQNAISEFHEIKIALKGETLPAKICDITKSELMELREEVTKQISRINELKANFWIAVEQY